MSFSQNPNVEEVVPANGLAVGFKGGRPPDEVADEVVNILERSGSPVPEVVQPLLKRGRNLEEAMLIDDESGQVVPEGVVLVGDDSQVQAAADGLSAPSIPSFKDKLVGFKVVNRHRRQGAAIPNREPRTDTSIANGGSRFAVLEEEGNELGGEVVVSKQPEEKVEGTAWNGREALGGGRGRVRIISRSPSPKKDEADRLKVANIGGSGTQSVREAGSLGRETSLVAAQGLVVPVKSALGVDKHAAVKVVDAGEGLNPKQGALDPVVARSFKLLCRSKEVLDHLAATPPPLPHLGEDVLGWRWDAKREFCGCRLTTPPAAIAIAVAEEKCHGKVGFESAVVDFEGSGSVDGSGLAVMD
ncbi:hypothetical protein V6N13_071879 [Hibiscus sabdariffa]